MPRLRQFTDPLGKSGIAFLVLALLALVFYLAGWKLLAVPTILTLLPLAAYLAFRLIRYVMRNSCGVSTTASSFSTALILILLGIGACAFFNELAPPLHWTGHRSC